MERMSLVQKYVNAALLRLRIEKIVYTMQSGMFFAIIGAVIIFVLSRLFVIPYYERFAIIIAVLAILGTAIYSIYNRVGKHEATSQLDRYIPHNLLLTAVSIRESDSILASPILEEANQKVSKAYEHFKRREKNLVNLKMLIASIVSSAILILLISFPSEAQIEAEAIEQEKVIVDEMKKVVENLIEKEKISENKTALEDLLADLKEAESSEEALKDMLKKQKEIRLQESRLTEKKNLAAESTNPSDGLSEAEEQELSALKEVATTLAKNIENTNTALRKIGKSTALPALAELPSSATSKGEGSGQGDEKAEGEGEGEGQGEGKGEGQGEGKGEGQGEGKGEGQGEGQGKGEGKEEGKGEGAGEGPGQGTGSGGRDLLAIPSERIGTAKKPIIDGGKINEGDFVEEKEVEGFTERGTIRPYNEVIGSYKKSYLESTGKMNLSPDLQRVLSNYFSSIE